MYEITEADKDWAVKADHEAEDLEAAGYDLDMSEDDWFLQKLG